MKELCSFIDVCENAYASKHFHCTEKQMIRTPEAVLSVRRVLISGADQWKI